jgi:hypothetical protein
MNAKTTLSSVFAVLAICVWIGSSHDERAAHAQSARPTIAPIPTATAVPIAASPAQTSAWIVLQPATAKLYGMRAVVQWQDPSGKWHDVEGWQSTLDARELRWWVAPRDYGSGPFRWATTRDGALQAASTAFMLPHGGGEVVVRMVE